MESTPTGSLPKRLSLGKSVIDLYLSGDIFPVLEQNIHMATTDAIPGLPETLQQELEKSASAQGRSVSEVLAEAVSGYLHERSWQALVESGRSRAKDLGLTEDDVPRLIAESRAEQGR